MNKLTKLFALVAGLAAVAASAVPLNITVGSNGALLNGVGIADSTYYDAHVPAPSSNDATDNWSFLDTEVGYWNTNFNPDLPYHPGALALEQSDLGGASSYSTLAGYDYVVLHFGSGPAGSKGGWWQAYYLGGEGGFLFSSLPQVGESSVGGFSSARYFGGTPSVPDSGSTVALLGLSLVAVAFAARRKQSAA